MECEREAMYARFREGGEELMRLLEPVSFAVTWREGVWTLRRQGKVIMRSRVEPRVARRQLELAIGEAARHGWPTLCLTLRPDGSSLEQHWTPDEARNCLEAGKGGPP